MTHGQGLLLPPLHTHRRTTQIYWMSRVSYQIWHSCMSWTAHRGVRFIQPYIHFFTTNANAYQTLSVPTSSTEHSEFTVIHNKRNSSVAIVTRLPAGQATNRGSIPSNSKNSPKLPDRLCGSIVNLPTHLNLVPRLRMSGAIFRSTPMPSQRAQGLLTIYRVIHLWRALERRGICWLARQMFASQKDCAVHIRACLVTRLFHYNHCSEPGLWSRCIKAPTPS
jgi:hypothetical protein